MTTAVDRVSLRLNHWPKGPSVSPGAVPLPTSGWCANAGLAPDVLLHAFSRWHPGTARLTPARRTRDGFFHTELIGERSRVFEGILPLGGHVNQAFFDYFWCRQGSIEVLETTQANPILWVFQKAREPGERAQFRAEKTLARARRFSQAEMFCAQTCSAFLVEEAGHGAQNLGPIALITWRVSED